MQLCHETKMKHQLKSITVQQLCVDTGKIRNNSLLCCWFVHTGHIFQCAHTVSPSISDEVSSCCVKGMMFKSNMHMTWTQIPTLATGKQIAWIRFPTTIVQFSQTAFLLVTIKMTKAPDCPGNGKQCLLWSGLFVIAPQKFQDAQIPWNFLGLVWMACLHYNHHSSEYA